MIYNHLSQQAAKASNRGIRQVDEGYLSAEDWNTQTVLPHDVLNGIQLQKQQKSHNPLKLQKQKQKPGQMSVQETGVMEYQ